jgi:dipeptidyl-peptidase-4
MLISLILSSVLAMQNSSTDPALLTVAEQSNYTATSSSDEVLALIGRIEANSDITRTGELGKTHEGRTIPLIFLANPPVDSVDAAVAASKQRSAPIIFIMANIHAGEIEGKEACLMLARELALDPDHTLLKHLIVVIAPNYNADGNDRFGDVATNRPGQDGPPEVGIRRNAQDLDLNRDYIKLEAPETRALVAFLNQCDPHITIDCHTTNGSQHRYTLTYDAPTNPSGHPAPINFIRNGLLPAVTERVRASTGYEMFFYGNFNKAHTTWESYSAMPRFGGPYQGLRGQMSILSEAYSYAPYKDRVLCTLAFVREILEYAAEHKQEVLEINQRARRETASAGRNSQPDDVVGIRHALAAFPEPVLIKGYEGARGGEGGSMADMNAQLGEPKDYQCVHLGRFEATRSVVRPWAYVVPMELANVIDVLAAHGVHMEIAPNTVPSTPRRPVEVDADFYTIDTIRRSERLFEGHNLLSVEATASIGRRRIPPDCMLIRTAQPLSNLIVYMLEPESDDGLVAWNFFGDHLKEGAEFPVWRVRSEADLR